jgi:hypothetical protein
VLLQASLSPWEWHKHDAFKDFPRSAQTETNNTMGISNNPAIACHTLNLPPAYPRQNHNSTKQALKQTLIKEFLIAPNNSTILYFPAQAPIN